MWRRGSSTDVLAQRKQRLKEKLDRHNDRVTALERELDRLLELQGALRDQEQKLIAYEEADDTMRRKLFEDVHAKFKEEHLSSLEAQMRVQCATSCDEITLKYNRRAKREARKAVDALEAHRAAWACPRRAIEIVYVGWGELALRVVKWARWLCSGMWWPWRGAPKVGKARTA